MAIVATEFLILQHHCTVRNHNPGVIQNGATTSAFQLFIVTVMFPACPTAAQHVYAILTGRKTTFAQYATCRIILTTTSFQYDSSIIESNRTPETHRQKPKRIIRTPYGMIHSDKIVVNGIHLNTYEDELILLHLATILLRFIVDLCFSLLN